MSAGSEYNFACDKCPRTFKLEEFYDKHKKVHELKKQHKCDICGFVYGAAKGLEGHVKTHTDEEIAAAHQASRQKALQKAGGGGNGIPFGADFHFLNPQGVLAQAKIPVSPKKEDEVAVREQLNGKAPSPAGTGNYTIYGKHNVPEVSDASAAVQNDSGFFMCSICKREFSGLNSLKKHIPIHTRKIQHKCDVCGYVFGKKEYLLDHMRKHTGEVSPICEVCGQTFNKSLKLKEHFKLHRNTGSNSSMSPYKCHICNAVFARPDVLGNHLTVAHAETVYKCDICEATFGDVRGKNHHMYNEHQLDAFHQKCVWCPVCNQGFTRHYNLKVHMYKSHGKEYIENNFTPAELQALVKSAPSPPTMTSPPMQKAGPLSSKKIVPQAPLEFNCKMCGSKFLTKNKLMQHMQSHGVVLIPCPTCGDKFMSQIELKDHQAKLHPPKKRRPGPASKTNAPPEKRGITSLPTYLQLTQVSRRSSACSDVNKQMSDKPQAGNMTAAGGAALTALISQLATAAAAKAPNERQACNFCTKVCKNPTDLSQHLMNDHFKGLITSPPEIKCSRCPGKTFSSQSQMDAHIKTVHRAKEIRRTLGLDSSPPYRRPGPKRARLFKDTEDAHQKETDELRPSLLAARSDAAAAAAKEKSEMKAAEDDCENEMVSDEASTQNDEDVRYEPITEDFMYEDMVISPCYVVLPYVNEEEVEAAMYPPDEEIEEQEQQQDYLDDEAPLTIDESIVDDEPDLPKSPIKASDLQEEMHRRTQKIMEYNAEDINGGQPGYYPAMADFSLPFSMASIWKKKADELGNFNPVEHLALMQKIEIMQKYNGSVVGPPSPPSPPPISNGVLPESPKKPKTKPSPPAPTTPKEKKFISNGNNTTPVADYESQIKNDIWPLDCIKCNSLLGNLDNFNLHMNDHWSDDKCCPVCGLLINSKRFNFKQHLKIHTGEKPFTCNICNRSFRQKAHMVKHVTTHRTLPNGTPAPLALEAK